MASATLNKELQQQVLRNREYLKSAERDLEYAKNELEKSEKQLACPHNNVEGCGVFGVPARTVVTSLTTGSEEEMCSVQK